MINCFILLFYIECAQIVVSLSSVVSNDSLKGALNYIDSVQKRLNMTQNSSIILVIGNTGCGKSTLVHYVAGDYSRMFAFKPLNRNSVNFEIRDELDPDRDRISLATESRTLIPVISTDENHNVWMDCPGFGDTRNETVEIATTFMIKRAIENASNIKVVLVVNYDSVTKTNSRDDFDNLLSRATQLMKNVTQFENSVSLVVTKAPPFKMRGRHFIDIFENNVKNTTAQFMLETKTSDRSKILLIKSLLGPSTTTYPYYPKISIFWRPNDVGPLNKIEKMFTGRRYIRESILNHSSYAPVRITDFGFPLTPKAQVTVRNMVQHTVDTIEKTLNDYINRLIVEMQRQIELAKTAKSRLEVINIGLPFIQMKKNESQEAKKITLDQLAEQLAWLIREYNVSAADMKVFYRISRHEKNVLILSSLIAPDVNSSHNTINLDYYSYSKQVNEFLMGKYYEIHNGIEKKEQEMKEFISKILVNSDQQLLQALHRKIESINGFQNRLNILQTEKKSIQLNGKEITLKERIEQLRRLTYAVELPSINVTALSYVNRYEKMLNELNSLVGGKIQLPIRDWIAKSSNAIDYLVSKYDWYLFLDETYRYFSEQDISSRDHVPCINKSNFSTITKLIRRNADFESTPKNIIEINKIINIAMKSPPTYHCNNDTLTIKGRFIRISDIENALVTKCSADLTTVKVMVLDTLYVDSDLNLRKTNEVELQIMAPKWNIQKHAKFWLNGINGKSHNESAAEGSGGEHGFPGTNGGNFFGWANVIINNNWLSVDLSGGHGSNGQDGSGSPDVAVNFDKIDHSDSGDVTERGTLNNYFLRYFRQHGYHPKLLSSTGDVKSTSFFNYALNVTHTFVLLPDRCCGQTGAGGEGGLGGAGGSAIFIYSSEKEKLLPKIIKNNGKNGEIGMDGRQCETSELVLSVVTQTDHGIFRYQLESKFYDVQRRHFNECPIQHGLVFYPGNAKPAPKRMHDSINFIPSLIEYNSYLLKNMNDPEDNVAQSTYKWINSDPVIISVYKIKDLAMEANSLEQNYSELSKYMNMLPLYDNLLKRIKHFAAENVGKLSPDDKNVLALIYTTIFSKTTGMRSSHTSDLIIHIRSFLDLTAQNVKKLKELKRIDVIHKQFDEYNITMSTKIKEEKNYIENDFNPEIKRTIAMLNNELKKAVDETFDLQSKTRNEIYSKQEQLTIIRRNVNMRRILGIIEWVGDFVLAIGGSIEEKISGFVMKSTAQTVKSVFVVDPKINEKLKVPKSVERLLNTMHKNKQEKIKATENELKKLKKSLLDFNMTNHELTNNLDEFIANTTAIMMRGSVVNHEVNNFLEKSIELLREWQNVATAERKVSFLRPIQRTQHALIVIATSFPTYKEICSDYDKISEVVRALNEDVETLEALKRFEEGIYSDLMPIVDEMYEINIEENVVNKSLVALDVTSWNVKRTIRNVQKKLIDELAQFDIESNINECMVQINEVMELLINAYNRIQNYEEKIKFATYVSELHITSDSYSHDAELNQILIEMEKYYQVNLFLAQYFRVLGAFKQAVFPYAADYLFAYELPSSLLVDNSSISITRVSQQIESLCEKLKEYNDTAIQEQDEHIHSASFNRNNGSRGPFYVWPNSEIRDRIQQLFNGKKIYLFADVEKSDTRNAVKFNKIELGFHSANQMVNNKLHEILQSFHIRLTHMGSSNYRCNDKFYTIPSRPWTIEYSIGATNEIPSDQNLVRAKLASGPSLLSPYTLWSMQLLYGKFNQLQPYIYLIDIEMYGGGLYLKENAPICETNLEKYYSTMGKIL